MEGVVKKFNQLTAEELYEILRVRAEVFVVSKIALIKIWTA